MLVGPPSIVPVNITPPAKRRADEQVKAQYDPNNPNSGADAAASAEAAADAVSDAEAGRDGDPRARPEDRRVPRRERARSCASTMPGREHGQIRRVQQQHVRPDQGGADRRDAQRRLRPHRAHPRRRHAGRARVQHRQPHLSRRARPSYNTIAEIPGTDKADEVVMLGGHLDSWHSATGATDNAIGCAIMMEAARILKALGVKPRRTIRVALWGGEEQGLLGSKAYVEAALRHVRRPEAGVRASSAATSTSTPARAASAARRVFGPPEAARRSCASSSSRSRTSASYGAIADDAAARRGGTDSTSFNDAGLPGIGLGQDPIEYNSHTWHTNLDTYERIVEDDVKKSAVVVASARLSPRDARRDAAALRARQDAAAAAGAGSIKVPLGSTWFHRVPRGSVPPGSSRFLEVQGSRFRPGNRPPKLDGVGYAPDNRHLRSFR